MLVAKKVRLLPTKVQEEWLRQNTGVSRFIYNWALAYKIEMYQTYGVSVGQSEIMKEVTDLKYTDDYSWLQGYNSETIKQSVKDMLAAYNQFFKQGCKGYPKFKKKGRCKESFYVRYDRLHSVDEYHIRLPSLKSPMKVSESCTVVKGTVKNPRISFDGKYWYLLFSYEAEPLEEQLSGEILGIDLGIKELAVCSSGVRYRNVNKDTNVIKLESRKRRFQRQISRMYLKNSNKKTNNIRKLERKVRLIDRKLSNIRKTYIHQVTMEIVKTKPSTIVLEDLDIQDMMKNKYLAGSIQNQCWYFFRHCIEYKSKFYGGIQVVLAPRTYPSSKRCSCCGHVKKFLSLSDRTYICDDCGFICDRDLNASYNLRDLAIS